MGVLRADNRDDPECSDYTLDGDAISCWITVGNISVYVVRTDEGVAVDLYAKGREESHSLAGTWALQQEAATEEELDAGQFITRPQIP